MKKLMIMALALVAMTMASCGDKTKAGAATDSVATDSVEAVAEPTEISALAEQLKSGDASAVEQAITTVKQKYDQLVTEGKVEEAAAYASKMKEFIDEHSEEIKQATNGSATVSTIVDAVKNLPSTVTTTAEDAASAAGADAKAVGDKVKDAVEAAPAKAEEAVKAKTDEAKKKAADAVDKKVNEGVDKALKGVGLK